jgi:acyl-CoA thioester hydrolase
MLAVHHPSRPSDARHFVLPVRVYYEDTDAAGVVYYANYLKFCERARTEWLRGSGFTNSALLAERGLAFVVRAVKADYLAPAVLDDALQVVSTLDKLGGASLIFGQRVLRGEELLFDAQIVIACVDLCAKRASPIPADIKQQLQALCQP